LYKLEVISCVSDLPLSVEANVVDNRSGAVTFILFSRGRLPSGQDILVKVEISGLHPCCLIVESVTIFPDDTDTNLQFTRYVAVCHERVDRSPTLWK